MKVEYASKSRKQDFKSGPVLIIEICTLTLHLVLLQMYFIIIYLNCLFFNFENSKNGTRHTFTFVLFQVQKWLTNHYNARVLLNGKTRSRGPVRNDPVFQRAENLLKALNSILQPVTSLFSLEKLDASASLFSHQVNHEIPFFTST